MELADDHGPDTSSGLADLRQVPLKDLYPLSGYALNRVLPQTVADSSSQPLPVAAFNSCI
jgi:FXSXX-COOH protein